MAVQNDEMDRQPTESEVEFGKNHGIPALIEYAQGRLKAADGNARGGGKSAVQGVEDHQPEQGKVVVHRPLQKGRRKSKMPVESSDSEGSANTSSSDDEAEAANSGNSDSGDSSDGDVDSDDDDNSGKREDSNGVSSEEEVDGDEESMEHLSPSKSQEV